MFSSIKNWVMAIGAALVSGYVLKMKYDAYQAESKLVKIEGQIAKANVVVAKDSAKKKAKVKDIETETHIEILKELTAEKKKVVKEMEVIEKEIEKNFVNNEKTTGSRRGTPFKMSN